MPPRRTPSSSSSSFVLYSIAPIALIATNPCQNAPNPIRDLRPSPSLTEEFVTLNIKPDEKRLRVSRRGRFITRDYFYVVIVRSFSRLKGPYLRKNRSRA